MVSGKSKVCSYLKRGHHMKQQYTDLIQTSTVRELGELAESQGLTLLDILTL